MQNSTRYEYNVELAFFSDTVIRTKGPGSRRKDPRGESGGGGPISDNDDGDDYDDDDDDDDESMLINDSDFDEFDNAASSDNN